MGIHIIKMPDIGEGIAEVELVEWYVQPGDTVAEDQVLADVMTDELAAYKLAGAASPGHFGILYQVKRPTKNALEQKWIDDTQAKLGGMSQKDLLRKRFEAIR